VSAAAISGVGDVFVMRVHAPVGDYEMDNRVVRHEPHWRIGWGAAAGHGRPRVDRS
jgi:hypothetical protein